MVNELNYIPKGIANRKSGILRPEEKNGETEEARVLNAYLTTMRFKIFNIHRKFLESDQEMTGKLIRTINRVASKTKLVFETFQQHNDKLKQLVGIDYALGTLDIKQLLIIPASSFCQKMDTVEPVKAEPSKDFLDPLILVNYLNNFKILVN